MDEKFAPGPERKLTLVVVTPGAESAGVVAMIGTSASAMIWRISVNSCNSRHGGVRGVGNSLRSSRHIQRSPSRRREYHCTVPRARPLGLRLGALLPFIVTGYAAVEV